MRMPATRRAGRTSRLLFQPQSTTLSHSGTHRERNGTCRPMILPSVMTSRPLTPAATATGNACRGECNGRAVCNQAEDRRLARGEPQAHEHGRRDGDGGPESRGAFQERSECECDEERLHAPVGGDRGKGRPDHVELAGCDAQRVDPESRNHDPEDGEHCREGPLQPDGKGGDRRHGKPEHRASREAAAAHRAATSRGPGRRQAARRGARGGISLPPRKATTGPSDWPHLDGGALRHFVDAALDAHQRVRMAQRVQVG